MPYYTLFGGSDERIWMPETESDPGDMSAPWRKESGLSDFEFAELSALLPDEAASRLVEVGEDIGRAQRDGWLYWNLAEALKTAHAEAPNSEVALDNLAGNLINRLRDDFDMLSGLRRGEDGGPPNETRSRPWKAVLNWLLERIADVGRFLITCLEAVSALLATVLGPHLELSVSPSVILGLPPAVEFEVGIAAVRDRAAWERVKKFLDTIADKTGGAFRSLAQT